MNSNWLVNGMKLALAIGATQATPGRVPNSSGQNKEEKTGHPFGMFFSARNKVKGRTQCWRIELAGKDVRQL